MTADEHAKMQELEGLVKRYRSRIAALNIEHESILATLDSVAPLRDGEVKTLADRVRDEMADFVMVMDNCSKVYDHITRSRISKPNTLASEVIREADSIANADLDDALREAEERA